MNTLLRIMISAYDLYKQLDFLELHTWWQLGSISKNVLYGDLDSYLGLTIWKLYTFLGPNIGDNFSNIIMKMGMVLAFGRIVGILVLCCLNMDLGSAMAVNTVNAKVSSSHNGRN